MICPDGRVQEHRCNVLTKPPRVQAALVQGPDGNLWVTLSGNNHIIRMTLGGVITGDFTNAGIADPYDIVVGADGNMWFTNYFASSVGRITTAGVITIFSGGPMSNPQGLSSGPDGNLWVADTGSNNVWKITT